jgi:hypothetical protein
VVTSLQPIEQAASGLLYLSEGDFPFEPFTLTDSPQTLKECLLARSGQERGVRVEKVSLDHFFRNQIQLYAEDTLAQRQTAARFQSLVQVLKQELIAPVVYRIGEVRVEAFVVGKLSDGTYGGLWTKVIET